MAISPQTLDLSTVSRMEGVFGSRFRELEEIVSGAALQEHASEETLVDWVVHRAMAPLESSGTRVGADVFSRRTGTEKVVLALLHRCGWSYDRVAAAVGLKEEELEELAWSTRLAIAFAPDHPKRAQLPVGSPRFARDCPEYFPARPWTQRFLDGQIAGSRLAFLKQHLGHCESCRSAVASAKSVYYGVEAVIPAVTEPRRRAHQLEKVYWEMRYLRNPLEQPLQRQIWDGVLQTVRAPSFAMGALVFVSSMTLFAVLLSLR